MSDLGLFALFSLQAAEHGHLLDNGSCSCGWDAIPHDLDSGPVGGIADQWEQHVIRAVGYASQEGIHE